MQITNLIIGIIGLFTAFSILYIMIGMFVFGLVNQVVSSQRKRERDKKNDVRKIMDAFQLFFVCIMCWPIVAGTIAASYYESDAQKAE